MFLPITPVLALATTFIFMLAANTRQNSNTPSTQTPAVVVPTPNASPTQTVAKQTSTAATAWKIDDTHSMGLFRVQHFGAGMFWGRFDGVTGTISTSGTPMETLALNVVIDTNSVSSANKDLDSHLRSPDFFSVKEFPEMSFVSTSSKKLEGNTWSVNGNLTMHGVTKPITVNMEMTGQSESARGNKIGFEAVFTIDRSEFGMTYGIEKNAIGKSVRIIVALEATSS
jgi:polyisoprenoid-binding protein YceI